MPPYILDLLWRSLQDTLGRGYSRTLLSVFVLAAIYAINYIIQFAKERPPGVTVLALIKQHFAKAAIRPTLKVWVGLFAVVFVYFLVRNINSDHQSLVKENRKLITENEATRKELEWRQHNISTADAVFPNLIYMLQAFERFRLDMKGEPCVVFISATKESAALASTIAQLSVTETQCATFGPDRADSEPEPDEELMRGIVPDAIVVHAVEADRAADGLFSTLGNQIQLRRSHRMLEHPEKRWSTPWQGKEHVVWLQFGSNVKWNSELRDQESIIVR